MELSPGSTFLASSDRDDSKSGPSSRTKLRYSIRKAMEPEQAMITCNLKETDQGLCSSFGTTGPAQGSGDFAHSRPDQLQKSFCERVLWPQFAKAVGAQLGKVPAGARRVPGQAPQ